jgi:DNA-nicking Smr family endonuclease
MFANVRGLYYSIGDYKAPFPSIHSQSFHREDMKKKRAFHGFDHRDDLLDGQPAALIDLHGITADECRRMVPNRLATWRNLYSGKVIHIIAGKGKGSMGRPVLKQLVRSMLAGTLRPFICEFSEDLDGGGYRARMN